MQSEGGRATGVLLQDGMTLSAGVVVNAAGPWCDDLFKDLGLATWPLAPTRIQIVHIDCPPAYYSQLPICAVLGSGLVDQSQKMTVAARAMAERKTVGHRS